MINIHQQSEPWKGLELRIIFKLRIDATMPRSIVELLDSEDGFKLDCILLATLLLGEISASLIDYTNF